MEGVRRYQAISFLRMAQAFVFSIVPFSSILIRFSHSPASMSKLNSASFKVTKNLSGYICSLVKYIVGYYWGWVIANICRFWNNELQNKTKIYNFDEKSLSLNYVSNKRTTLLIAFWLFANKQKSNKEILHSLWKKLIIV